MLNGIVVKTSQPAAMMVLGSNPGWGAQEFSKWTFISRNSAACQLHVTKSSLGTFPLTLRAFQIKLHKYWFNSLIKSILISNVIVAWVILQASNISNHYL